MYEAPLVEELKRRMLLDGNGAGGLANLPVDSRYRKNFMLVKFLRARDLDLDKAERMMRRALEWRAEYGTDSLLDDFAPDDWLIQYAAPPQLADLFFAKASRLPWYIRDRDGEGPKKSPAKIPW